MKIDFSSDGEINWVSCQYSFNLGGEHEGDILIPHCS